MSRCYQMDFCRWQKVNMHGKQRILLYSHMKVSPFFIIREVLKKERGRDPDCVPDVVSLCLSQALPGSSPSLSNCSLGQNTNAHLTEKAVRLSSSQDVVFIIIIINPYKNAPMFSADVQINYCCR